MPILLTSPFCNSNKQNLLSHKGSRPNQQCGKASSPILSQTIPSVSCACETIQLFYSIAEITRSRDKNTHKRVSSFIQNTIPSPFTAWVITLHSENRQSNLRSSSYCL